MNFLGLGSSDEGVRSTHANVDELLLVRGMVGTARGAESLPHVALQASQFRPWVQDYRMPASQSGTLHHQFRIC